MEVRDSRRLTGPNVLWERPGAVLELAVDDAERDRAVDAWLVQVRRLLDAVGWTAEETATRTFPGGASLAISAPIDALYAATEVNEAAWSLAERALAGGGDPELTGVDGLRRAIEREGDPRLLALRAAARERGVAFLSDDDEVSVGMGAGSRTFPVGDVPEPEGVDWGEVRDVPCAMVTGTNGKTTTVRLLAAMARAAGRTPGLSSTDWIRVGDEHVDEGDWSGPGGARQVLRHPRVDLAILETARGGMLRRGLALDRVDAALVTNVAADHLGEWGIHDLAMLADTKMVVARAADLLVLNADDPMVRERGPGTGRPLVWFSLDPRSPALSRHVAEGGRACVVEEGLLVARDGAHREPIVHVDEVPITLDGAAHHNVANALGAIGVARALGMPLDAIRAGLRGFRCSPEENPGRLNEFRLGAEHGAAGVRALVDFAHNPHGFEAFFEMAGRLEARRRLVLLGQAGDRRDEEILQLVRIVWAARPDRIVVKEMPEHLRGRREGEVPAMIAAELDRLGTDASRIGRASSELEAVRDALAWARDGDLLLLLCHAERERVLELLAGLDRAGWRPGEPIPAS